MSCLKAQASLEVDFEGISAVLVREDIDILAGLIREEIEIRAEIDCSDLETNVLCASDGVLYSSEPEPLFVTE